MICPFCRKDVLVSSGFLSAHETSTGVYCPAAGLSVQEARKRYGMSIVESYRRMEWSEGAIRAWHERERRVALLREALGFVVRDRV